MSQEPSRWLERAIVIGFAAVAAGLPVYLWLRARRAGAPALEPLGSEA